ncbi:hypothetical protein NIE88_05525 [Sporolactobacillus shoreicorticis]|uniref:Uncharacterized protein n=1 Tax=Sporolactobacillus shoreicorticis TaxID=1923877 RepID=A0ABW5S0V5_9BACL|nr:hypothetical protein [Sporolactobacillus shoreicorticis]MCO7125233.1 hypothetical protein [Sporolactobacillus shoreicorticis]
MQNTLITVSEILNKDWFTEWELEDIVLDSADQWFLIFEDVGYLNKLTESVYICHDPEIKQKLLAPKKRRDLSKKFGSAGEKNNTPGCIGRKRK